MTSVILEKKKKFKKKKLNLVRKKITKYPSKNSNRQWPVSEYFKFSKIFILKQYLKYLNKKKGTLKRKINRTALKGPTVSDKILENTKIHFLKCTVYQESNFFSCHFFDYHGRLLWKISSKRYLKRGVISATQLESFLVFKYFAYDIAYFCLRYGFKKILTTHVTLESDIPDFIVKKRIKVFEELIHNHPRCRRAFKVVSNKKFKKLTFLPFYCFEGKNFFAHNGCRLRRERRYK